MYQSAVRQRSQPQGTSVHSPQRQQNRDRNKIRLLQLSICLLLFLAVFVGRGVFPSELGNLESTVHQLLTAEPDMGGGG